MGRTELAGLMMGGGPAGEDAECLVRGRTWFGAVSDDDLSGVGGDLQGVVVEVEVTGQGWWNGWMPLR